jgi:D-aminoacyl-tRNA deacylase
MRFAILCSRVDAASMSIKRALCELYSAAETGEFFEDSPVLRLGENASIYTTFADSINCEDIDRRIEADFFIFATKHKAQAGVPSLSVHTQGNWARAEFGGRDNMLCVSPACYLKEGLIKLNEWAGELKDRGFDIIQECTHHGPYIEKPSMFIEVGSTEKDWENMDAARVVARVIHHLVNNEPMHCRTAVGMGGLHHTPSFKRIVLESEFALGHVCPRYMLEHLTKEMVLQAIDKTMPRAELVILDWKGLKGSKERIMQILGEINIEVKRTHSF